jgi:transglutaminase-like putative cysteine protease
MRTLASGLAVLLSCSALGPVFEGRGWLAEVLGAVVVVVLAGLAGRRLGVPGRVQPVLSAAALAAYLVAVFAHQTLRWGLFPTGQTWARFDLLITAANSDLQKYAAPIPTSPGLLLMTAAAVGVLAILVDLIAVVLERPAAAGLPLLALLAVPSATLPGGLGGLPFVLGAAGWLLLLLVDSRERMSRWGSTLAAAGDGQSSITRSARRIGGLALSLAVLVPLAVPGLDERLIGSAIGSEVDDGEEGGANSARTYNPITRLRGQLTLPNPVQLLQYRTDDPNPDYLRMTTLDTYDGRGWSASPLSQPRDEARVQNGIRTPVGEGGPARDYRTRIQVDGNRLSVYWLPLPYGPRAIDVRGIWLWDPGSQTVFSASRTTAGLPEYRVTGRRVLPDRAVLAAARADQVDPTISRRYGGQLPISPSVRALTARITDGASTPYGKAVALQSFFRTQANGFVYDLTPPQPRRDEDQLAAFLRNRRGFCEQYATAMGAMLRAAGVPSRVAVGFTRGAPLAGSAGTYSVSTSEAHAWPEAWFAGTGWVRFEPTPSAAQSVTPDYTRPVEETGSSPTGPTTPTAEPSASPTATPSSKPRNLLPEEETGSAGGSAGSDEGGLSKWLLVPWVALAVAAVPGLLMIARRRQRWRRPSAGVAWEQVRDDAHDVGHRWLPADSPRTAASRLVAERKLPSAAATALEGIALRAEQLRYAPAGRAAGPDRAADVAQVRHALRQGSTRGVRIRAQLFSPSTIAWALGGLGDAIELGLERWGEVSRRWRSRLPRRA